ncbi:MAG: prolipoprotein diacylglyceryl transferase, partial [Cytophagaceae bacterium]
MLNFIIWDANPDIFAVGDHPIRWYGLLFAMGFLLGQQILIRIYKGEGKSEKHVETLTIYMVVATIIGARLGHCLFYEPDYYLSRPWEILMIWQGGLASHGAALGILIAIYIYSRREVGQGYFYVLDRLVITIALAGALIRTGNLMNSEIIGLETSASWGFIFVEDPRSYLAGHPIIDAVDFEHRDEKVQHHDILLSGVRMNLRFAEGTNAEVIDEFIRFNLREMFRHPNIRDHLVLPESELNYDLQANIGSINIYGIPRHPAQLYEAMSSFLLFLLLLYMYSRKKEKLPHGRLLGLFIVVIFSLRFLYEFVKEAQVAFEEDMMFNMGQLLSIPLVIAGLFIFFRSYRKA